MTFFKCLLLSAPLLMAQNYEPLTAEARVKWFAKSTYGPKSLFVSGPFTAGWRTRNNRPEEWGSGLDGFGKRYGMRLVNNSVTNGVEGFAGAMWDEDPRYFRMGQGSLKRRLSHAAKMTFLSHFDDGRNRFGAAKAVGIVSGSFAQKLWMPDSITSNRDCLIRIGGGYSGRFFGNVFREFVPDLLKAFKKN